MQSKMKVSFSETRETFMKRFCFPGHVLNCLLSADNAMQCIEKVENVNTEYCIVNGVLESDYGERFISH